jgi:macrodomain Ter protein organizer (MatP/YcbG family)
MGRPAYKINERDFTRAKQYILNAIDHGELNGAVGYMALRQAATPELLQTWCDDYLPQEIWVRLKQAVRQARKRGRDYQTPYRKVSVDLDHTAHTHLSMLAADLGDKTLSETILIMEEGYLRAVERGLI